MREGMDARRIAGGGVLSRRVGTRVVGRHNVNDVEVVVDENVEELMSLRPENR